MLKTLFQSMIQGRWMPITVRPVARAAAIVCAIAVNWFIHTVGVVAGAGFLVVDQTGRVQVGYSVLAFFTTQVALIGWVVMGLLERVTRFGPRIWTVGATCLLALSGLPVVLAQTDLTSRVFLAIINTATYLVIVPVMRRTARPTPWQFRRAWRARRFSSLTAVEWPAAGVAESTTA